MLDNDISTKDQMRIRVRAAPKICHHRLVAVWETCVGKVVSLGLSRELVASGTASKPVNGAGL